MLHPRIAPRARRYYRNLSLVPRVDPFTLELRAGSSLAAPIDSAGLPRSGGGETEGGAAAIGNVGGVPASGTGEGAAAAAVAP